MIAFVHSFLFFLKSGIEFETPDRNGQSMVLLVLASPNFICHFLREQYCRDYLLDDVCMVYVCVMCMFCSIVFNLCAKFELVNLN